MTAKNDSKIVIPDKNDRKMTWPVEVIVDTSHSLNDCDSIITNHFGLG